MPPAWHGAAVPGRVEGDREPEPVPVARREPAAPGVLDGGVGVVHVQRLEDVPLQVGLEWFSGHHLHDQPQRGVVEVGVLKRRAGRPGQPGRRQCPDGGFQRVHPGRQRGSAASALGQAAGLIQQVTDGDLRGRLRISDPEPRYAALDRRI